MCFLSESQREQRCKETVIGSASFRHTLSISVSCISLLSVIFTVVDSVLCFEPLHVVILCRLFPDTLRQAEIKH